MSADKQITLNIEIPDGNANSVWIVGRDPDWKGNVIVCPRACFETARLMKQFSQPGVYILRKVVPLQLPQIYIGYADPIKERLNNHYANKGFWQEVFVCVDDGGGKLNIAHIQHLEARLISMAKAANLCVLDQNTPQPPTLYKAVESYAENFLTQLIFVLRVLGVNIFEVSPTAAEEKSGAKMFFLKSKDVKAKGYQNAGEFVVLANSKAVLQIAPHALAGRIDIFRKSLESQGILKVENGRLIFTQNYSFSSPSAAAGVIIGGEADGRLQWKNEQGKSIKDLEVEAMMK
jgi:hypothetical protein